MLRVCCVVLACLAGCGVRTPAAIDVDTLLRARGPVEARRELAIRVTGDPRDVAGRLALAALDDRIQRPSEAIGALEAVVALGGPLGVRWRDEDRARLARLIAARGRARLARGAATATADLERARGLGAPISDDELRRARAAGAIARLHHSDAETRDLGRQALAALATAPPASAPMARDDARAMTPAASATTAGDALAATAVWLGAKPGAAPAERGRFGAWLWAQGAKRAAWDELSAWHDQTRAPRDPALQDAYLVAARWWTPLDRPGPPVDELSGAGRCAFGGCLPREVVGDEVLERAYLAAPLVAPVRDPEDAAALVVITLHQALRGEASWGPALAARVDLAAFAEPGELARLPAFAQPIIARLVGRPAIVPRDGETPGQRLVIAAARVLAGSNPIEPIAHVEDAPYVEALRRISDASAPLSGDARAPLPGDERALSAGDARALSAGDARAPSAGDLRAEAAARHAVATLGDAVVTLGGAAASDSLRATAAGFLRDPVIADRLGRDAVAGATDAAIMHAAIGALFDGLGDPARARAAWQAAVDASAEPVFVRGLAEAQGRQGDADAALVSATAAAAASGDPAVVWTAVARAIAGAGKPVQALEAARNAIDLAGPDTLAGALDVAIVASRALGRDEQVARLAAQRARYVAGSAAPRDGDPSDAPAALDAYRAEPSAATLDRLWLASRWNPRDVALRVALRTAAPPATSQPSDDDRRAVISAELVELAGDRDPEVRRAAVAGLR